MGRRHDHVGRARVTPRRSARDARNRLGKIGNLVERLVHGEMPGIENMDFGIRQVTSISRRTGDSERSIVFPPEHERRGLVLAQIFLPSRIVFHIGAVVVEEVALNRGLARPG